MTTTSSRAGKFEARFFHKIYCDEFANVRGHFGPINAGGQGLGRLQGAASVSCVLVGALSMCVGGGGRGGGCRCFWGGQAGSGVLSALAFAGAGQAHPISLAHAPRARAAPVPDAVAFSPDGTMFASGGEEGYVRLHHFDADYFTLKL